MTRLEEIKNGASVAGVVPNQSVEVVSVDWIGDQALNLVYRIPGGSVSETTLYRDDEHRLSVEQRGRAWSFDADGSLLRLVTEAKPFTQEPEFGVTAIQVNIKNLLERAEVPQ